MIEIRIQLDSHDKLQKLAAITKESIENLEGDKSNLKNSDTIDELFMLNSVYRQLMFQRGIYE